MSDPEKYDKVLSSILVDEKSIVGFLSTVFDFLARRTDFYYVPKTPNENLGFPPGVAEQIVLKTLRNCDPNNCHKNENLHEDIMASTVAQEVEVAAEEEAQEPEHHQYQSTGTGDAPDPEPPGTVQCDPPLIPVQMNSECYNGADRGNYCWSQTIMELDVIVKLPTVVKSSKDLKVTINSTNISVKKLNGDVIIEDSLPFKVKTLETFWSISEGRLLIHMEKAQERWWCKLLSGEEEIDLDKIDCSRPLDELPEDHVDKIRELQWNEERKRRGLPTSDQLRHVETLRRAWDCDGSPFKGQPFDPSVLQQ